jgi:hypothetical protein
MINTTLSSVPVHLNWLNVHMSLFVTCDKGTVARYFSNLVSNLRRYSNLKIVLRSLIPSRNYLENWQTLQNFIQSGIRPLGNFYQRKSDTPQKFVSLGKIPCQDLSKLA